MTVGTGGTGGTGGTINLKFVDKPAQEGHDVENRTVTSILGNLPLSGHRTVGAVTTVQCNENALVACLRQAYRAGKKCSKEE